MSATSSVNIQMNEVSKLIEDVDKKYFDLIYKATQDIFSDLKDGKSTQKCLFAGLEICFYLFIFILSYFLTAKHSLSEAVANSDDKSENMEDFISNISDSTFKECDSILNAAKKLNQSMAEARHFRALEQEFRRNASHICVYYTKLLYSFIINFRMLIL